MNNFEQDHAYIPPGSQQFPLFNEDSFPGAEHCIASAHGLPIPVDVAEFPWFTDLGQANLALDILTGAHAGMSNFMLNRPEDSAYTCIHIDSAADKLVWTRRTSFLLADDVSRKFTRYIAACLSGKDTYGSWLVKQLSENYLWDTRQTNTARLQWLEQMIVYVKGNIKQLEENETAACTQQEVYLNTPDRWLTTK